MGYAVKADCLRDAAFVCASHTALYATNTLIVLHVGKWGNDSNSPKMLKAQFGVGLVTHKSKRSDKFFEVGHVMLPCF